MIRKEVLKVLKISPQTLRNWIVSGKIRATRKDNGQFLYWDEDVWALVGKRSPKATNICVYTRVAGTTESDVKNMHAQKMRLSEWCNARGIVPTTLFEDWARGTELSMDRRPGLHQLLQDVIQKKVSAIIIETKDRLARVGTEILEVLFTYYGVELIITNRVFDRTEYIEEQEKDLVLLLEKAKIERLEQLGGELYPKPNIKKIKNPGKIVTDWEGQPDPPTSRDLGLSDLM